MRCVQCTVSDAFAYHSQVFYFQQAQSTYSTCHLRRPGDTSVKRCMTCRPCQQTTSSLVDVWTSSARLQPNGRSHCPKTPQSSPFLDGVGVPRAPLSPLSIPLLFRVRTPRNRAIAPASPKSLYPVLMANTTRHSHPLHHLHSLRARVLLKAITVNIFLRWMRCRCSHHIGFRSLFRACLTTT